MQYNPALANALIARLALAQVGTKRAALANSLVSLMAAAPVLRVFDATGALAATIPVTLTVTTTSVIVTARAGAQAINEAGDPTTGWLSNLESADGVYKITGLTISDTGASILTDIHTDGSFSLGEIVIFGSTVLGTPVSLDGTTGGPGPISLGIQYSTANASLPGTTISGVIIDQLGVPVQGAALSVPALGGSVLPAITGLDGTFVITLASTVGNYTLNASFGALEANSGFSILGTSPVTFDAATAAQLATASTQFAWSALLISLLGATLRVRLIRNGVEVANGLLSGPITRTAQNITGWGVITSASVMTAGDIDTGTWFLRVEGGAAFTAFVQMPLTRAGSFADLDDDTTSLNGLEIQGLTLRPPSTLLVGP